MKKKLIPLDIFTTYETSKQLYNNKAHLLCNKLTKYKNHLNLLLKIKDINSHLGYLSYYALKN